VASCIALVHNNIICEPLPNSQGGGCTGDINLLSQYGPTKGALIQGNFLGANIGSAYCTYGGGPGSGTQGADHIVYKDNVFERTASAPECANYGPVTAFQTGGVGNIWTNNTWSDNGAAVPPAA
jgi:hypothetical protein